jgi:hypothetical protein
MACVRLFRWHVGVLLIVASNRLVLVALNVASDRSHWGHACLCVGALDPDMEPVKDLGQLSDMLRTLVLICRILLTYYRSAFQTCCTHRC